MQPLQGEFLGLAEVGFVEVTIPGAVGIPVPGAMAVLTTGGQGALGTMKGKRARIRLAKPGMPGLRANLNSWEALFGTFRQYQAIIGHPRNSMACHINSILLRVFAEGAIAKRS
jgi:hypothetical protein